MRFGDCTTAAVMLEAALTSRSVGKAIVQNSRHQLPEGARGLAMTTADAQFFWSNHPGRQAWSNGYLESETSPHRQPILDALGELGQPVGTVLDVGCNAGPLLKRLKMLGYSALGVDINALAVDAAKAAGLNAIVGTVPEAIERLHPTSIDAVVSCFALAYIDPSGIERTLRACLRVARVGLVLLEPTREPGSLVEPAYVREQYVDWRHDYISTLAAIADAEPPGRLRLDLTCRRTPWEGDALNAITIARLTYGQPGEVMH